ncbi:hypothetical protein BDW22DRAFT_1481783 [Trametopsis cervina]|nr:hypothetical protein BDW22DRAFT_1481783 [Trametopsis cervina]
MCGAPLNSSADLQALCCAGIWTAADHACALCPNPDLAGIGVRVAFYVQSFVNALLIIFSPTDSVPTAWAGTLLTLALVIAGFVSKLQGNLTLHHATLILNFATLSTISSLAVAPLLPIWRLSPTEYYERHRQRHALLYADDDDPRVLRSPSALAGSLYANTKKQRVKAAQRRQRAVLSVVLLLQVVLQWAWGIFLFVNPHYSQADLSGGTKLVLFLAPFDAGALRFAIWSAWLLFCLGVTMALVVYVAVSGARHAQGGTSSANTLGTGTGLAASTPVWTQWSALVRESWGGLTRGRIVGVAKIAVFAGLWAGYIAASEWQRAINCIFESDGGENNFGGLGQITAIFVALAPLWSLSVALYRYPSLRRRRRRHQTSSMRRRRDEDDEAGSLLRASVEISPPPQQHQHHMPLPSDETLRASEGGESFEMDVFRPVDVPISFPLPSLYHPPERVPSSDSASSSPSLIGVIGSGGEQTMKRRPTQRPRGPRMSISPRSPSASASLFGPFAGEENA